VIQSFQFSHPWRQIDAAGRFFRYESAAAIDGNVTIDVRADGQELGSMLPGDSIDLPVTCKLWEVRPRSTACTGLVKLGMSKVDTSRIDGPVPVLLSHAARTKRHQAFARVFNGVSVAGQILEWQLWVPASATRCLMVSHVRIAAGAWCYSAVLVNSTQAPNLAGSAVSMLNGLAHSAVGAQFECRTYTAPRASLPTSVGLVHYAGTANVNYCAHRFEEPVVVLPGNGITVALDNTSAGIQWTSELQFLEVPVAEL
jgi:hypothetical protein